MPRLFTQKQFNVVENSGFCYIIVFVFQLLFFKNTTNIAKHQRGGSRRPRRKRKVHCITSLVQCPELSNIKPVHRKLIQMKIYFELALHTQNHLFCCLRMFCIIYVCIYFAYIFCTTFHLHSL